MVEILGWYALTCFIVFLFMICVIDGDWRAHSHKHWSFWAFALKEDKGELFIIIFCWPLVLLWAVYFVGAWHLNRLIARWRRRKK